RRRSKYRDRSFGGHAKARGQKRERAPQVARIAAGGGQEPTRRESLRLPGPAPRRYGGGRLFPGLFRSAAAPRAARKRRRLRHGFRREWIRERGCGLRARAKLA